MARITFRCDEHHKEGLQAIAERWDVSLSDMMRGATIDFIMENPDAVPEWVQKDVAHEDILRRNRNEMRTMHFRQRVWEYVVNTLTNDNGEVAKFPPDPEKVRKHYGESVKEEIRKTHDEYKDEYIDHVMYCLDWYELMHPDTDTGSKTEEVRALATFYFKQGQEGKARRVVNDAADDGVLPPEVSVHDVLDQARMDSHNESWKHKWDDAIRNRSRSDGEKARFDD